MKKVISLLLAAILAFSVLAVSVAAAGTGGDYQTYYMNYDERDEFLHIVPLEGYSQYVLPGEDFRFTIKADEGYSTTLVVVEVDGDILEPNIHEYYEIKKVDSDKNIAVYLGATTDMSNLFSSLIVLVHNILAWFKGIFESLLSLAG